MELKKELVQIEAIKGTAFTQVTFDETYNLPDYLPDFFSVILSRGDVRLDESKAGPGYILVRGAMKFKVLYRTGQNDWKISSLEGEFPFQETLILEEADEFDMPQAEIVLEDLTVQMMNSRKLNIRALMEIRASARERKDLEVPVGLEAAGSVEILTQEERFLELRYRGKERCHIREEVKVPSNKPNIRQILWQQAQIFGMDTRVAEGRLAVQGEIQIFVVYLGEEEGRLQWFETKVPYQYNFQIPEADMDVIPYIIAKPQEVRCTVGPDADGEDRLILVEADLPADVWLYRERKADQLADLYALDRNLILERNPVWAARLHMKNESKCRVNDSLRIQDTDSDILQICAGFGDVELDRQEIVENGISVEGTVRVQVLYLTNSDSAPVGAMEGMLPFQYVVEIPDITPDCRVELQSTLELLSFLMKSSKELEVQAVVNIQVLVTSLRESELITNVREEDLKIEELNNQPGMVGLTITSKDNLWNIAKRYHTTVEAIRKTNHLEDKPVADGTKILLMKELSLN